MTVSEDARDRPDEAHRFDDVDQATIDSLGTLSEALEYVERARGHLYSFHQLSGTADLKLGEAVSKLRAAGPPQLADGLATEMVGSSRR